MKPLVIYHANCTDGFGAAFAAWLRLVAEAIDGITDPDERDRAYLKARAEAVGGATLRDYFAAAAMQGMAAQPESGDWPAEGIAKAAYQQADAMLAARKAGTQQ